MIGLALEDKRMNAGIAPLLLRRTGSMACAPRSHPSVIHDLQETQRDAGCFRFLFQGQGVRELLLESPRIVRSLGFDERIRLEPRVSTGISGPIGPEVFHFFQLGLFLCFGEPRKIPTWRIHESLLVGDITLNQRESRQTDDGSFGVS